MTSVTANENAVDTVHPQPSARREGLFRQADQAGYPVGWYPFGLSKDLAPGQLMGADLLDGRIVAFRGEDGALRVTSAYCKHMGADLSFGGAVIGNELQCPFHHWQYNGEGVCTMIPTGDRIPPQARLFSFISEEKYGVMYVWWGLGEPAYALPDLDGYTEEGWATRAAEIKLSGKVFADPWIFNINSVDFQHLETLHDIPNINPEVDWGQWSVAWTAQWVHEVVGVTTMSLATTGINGVITKSDRDGETLSHIVSTTRLGDRGLCLYMVVATEKGEGQEDRLDQLEKMHNEVANEDVAILQNIRLGDEHLIAPDKSVAKFLRWYHEYPHVSMLELERSASAG